MRALAFILVLLLGFSSITFAAPEPKLTLEEISAYDPGPNPNDPMQKELIDLIAEMPYMPGLSEAITGEQKFRLIFGPVFWRMIFKPNTIKILFIGQDATHIAEAAERTATAGYGGRAQDVANYLGVDPGAAFINTYAYTIYGQAAAFGTPYIYQPDGGGAPQARFTTLVDNPLWLMTYDQRSPITIWRNKLIDWIIRYNRDSLKLIVTFGGAARDAMGSYLVSRGAKVGSQTSLDQIDNIRLPLTKTVSAGSNKEFPVLLDKEGRDLYAALLGRRPNYKNVEDQAAVQKALEEAIKNDPQGTLDKMAHSGVIDPAQLGGYELDEISIAGGEKSRNLKKLILSDGRELGGDVGVCEFPHPTRLSQMRPAQAADAVAKGFQAVREFAKQIEPDPGFENKYAQGQAYEYGRAVLRPIFYSFGTPLSRQVGVSSASRLHDNPQVIVFGTRDRVDFDMKAIERMTKTKPAEAFSDDEIFTGRPRTQALRYTFDFGPGEEWAQLLKGNLDLKKIFKTKTGKTWRNDGIAAYNIKNHPSHGDFGHYRGTFENPRVLILADPMGVDDMITSRALTGARGQYLQGLMRDIGVPEDYLVIKTVPFDMDGATDKEYATVLNQTQGYREAILGKLLREKSFDLILTDGKFAASEINRLLGESAVPIVNIVRTRAADSGIAEAGAEITKLSAFKDVQITGQRANIPRAHLTFYAHVWEGTSGDSVIAAQNSARGMAYGLVAPAWAYKAKEPLDQNSLRVVEEMMQSLVNSKITSSWTTVDPKVRCEDGLIGKRAS